MQLDPSDPRKRYEQVASSLRALILTGDLEPGEKLRTVAKLADDFGVSKTTVERAIDLLKAERLVSARQGAGIFVREASTRPSGLRPHIESAFDAEAVQVDFLGFSGETLHGAISECLDKVRSGRYSPKSIQVRLILPDTSRPWALPAHQDGSDSPEFRARHQRTIDRYTGGLVEAVNELESTGLIASGSVEIRVVGSPPTSKLYIVNGTNVFFGWYPVTKHKVKYENKSISVVDLMGKDTELFHYEAGHAEDTATIYVSEAKDYFEAQWNLVATPQL